MIIKMCSSVIFVFCFYSGSKDPIQPDTNVPVTQSKSSQLLPLTCQSFLGPWCLEDHRPVRPPAALQRNILPPVTTDQSLPKLTPIPIRPAKPKYSHSEARVVGAPALQISQWIPDCHSWVGLLILLFLRQDYSLWSLSPCACGRKARLRGLACILLTCQTRI